MAQRPRAATKVEQRRQQLLTVARDESQTTEARLVAITDYARCKRTLPAELAAVRRQLLDTLHKAGRIQADLARLIAVDHARISRLLAQESQR